MAQAGVTDQSVLEASIAAHLAANSDLLPPEVSELSDQAALFASNNTNAFMFTGSADADSENTNFGESLSTKAIEKVIKLEERRRKEDDPAGDAGMIAELAARQREEMIRIGRLSVTRAELIAFSDAMDDPEFKAAFRQHLIDSGVPEHEVDSRMETAERMADTARKIEDGTATDAEIAQYEIDTADPKNVEVLEEGIEFQQGGSSVENRLALSPNTTSPNVVEAPAVTQDEADLMAMMDAGASAPVTSVADRQGPIISERFEMAVADTSSPVPLTTTPDTRLDATQDTSISFG